MQTVRNRGSIAHVKKLKIQNRKEKILADHSKDYSEGALKI